MLDSKNFNAYLCRSALWTCLIERTEGMTPEDAALEAVKKQMNSDTDEFSIGAAVSATPIFLFEDETILVYSPKILADLGMHKKASELIKFLS